MAIETTHSRSTSEDIVAANRAGLLAALFGLGQLGLNYRNSQVEGQENLFALLGAEGAAAMELQVELPEVAEFHPRQRLKLEKEALGFYITGHPLDKYDRIIKKITGVTIATLKEKAAPGQVKVAGVVSALKLRNTKKGERHGRFHLEVQTGFIEVIAWPDTYRKGMEILG